LPAWKGFYATRKPVCYQLKGRDMNIIIAFLKDIFFQWRGNDRGTEPGMMAGDMAWDGSGFL
jgi:hypothetical protein